MMNADGTGLRWFEFNVPNQATWQPFGFLSDGHRVLFLSMEPRRDGPGKPFEEYYHQTPTHIWIHDLDKGTLTEVANRERLAPFYGGGPLLNDNRFLMQVVRKDGAQIYSMNLDGSDAQEFTRAGDGVPYGLSVSPDGKRVAFHLATSSGYQVFVSDADGRNRVRVAAHPDHLYFGPVWSRDGEWLVFQDCLYKQDPGHDWADLYLCRPDGSEPRLLTTGQATWFGATYGGAGKPRRRFQHAVMVARRQGALLTTACPGPKSRGSSSRSARTRTISTATTNPSSRAAAPKSARSTRATARSRDSPGPASWSGTSGKANRPTAGRLSSAAPGPATPRRSGS